MKRSSSNISVEFLKIKKLKTTDSDDEENSIMKNIMSTIPDDIIQEILIRFPTLCSAFQSSLVCKDWYSIIDTPRSYFLSTFMDLHRSKAPPLTLLFGDSFISQNPILIHNNLPQTSSTHVSTLVDSFPCFHNLFTADSSLVVATYEDLLLVKKSTSYYVCNPITGQELMLPDHPRISGDLVRCGLVSESKNKNINKELEYSNFRVLLIFQETTRNNEYGAYRFIVFWSEAWQWTESMTDDSYFSSGNDDVVACNGRLYYLHLEMKSLYAVDFFRDKGDRVRITELLDEFCSALLADSEAQLRIGIFKERPRISQLFRVDSKHLCLKVWEVKYDIKGDFSYSAGTLALVHQVRIEAADADLDSMSVFVVAFHPSHGDQIFLLRDRSLYQYDLKDKKEVKVAEIHSNFHGKIMPGLRVFPFVHPLWPTLV